MKCSNNSCSIDASWQVGFRAWPEGSKGARAVVQPVVVFTAITVCDIHKHVIKLEHISSPKTKEDFNVLMARKGMKPIDFGTAEMVFSKIEDGGALPVPPPTMDKHRPEGQKPTVGDREASTAKH